MSSTICLVGFARSNAFFALTRTVASATTTATSTTPATPATFFGTLAIATATFRLARCRTAFPETIVMGLVRSVPATTSLDGLVVIIVSRVVIRLLTFALIAGLVITRLVPSVSALLAPALATATAASTAPTASRLFAATRLAAANGTAGTRRRDFLVHIDFDRLGLTVSTPSALRPRSPSPC